MLRVYKPISHNIFKAHEVIEYLVKEVWCKADEHPVEDKLNDILKLLYNNGRLKSFKKDIDDIYSVCQKMTNQDKQNFQDAFDNNNRIEELCNGTIKPIAISTLNAKLVKVIEPFFKGLYTGYLDWKTIEDNYGKKKSYYDELNITNQFGECPCCGFGDLKTIYSKGRSAYDHYLPQKHYPLSSTNFKNLVPICTTCNSDEKGEDDVLKPEKPLFYPFSIDHPNLEVKVDVDKNALPKLIKETDSLDDKIKSDEIKVDFNLKDERIESWDRIFDIRSRYFERIATNRVGWFKKVKKKFDKDKTRIAEYSVNDAFDDIIEDDSDDQLGFLKSPYLASLKSNSFLVKAISEVDGDSEIE